MPSLNNFSNILLIGYVFNICYVLSSKIHVLFCTMLLCSEVNYRCKYMYQYVSTVKRHLIIDTYKGMIKMFFKKDTARLPKCISVNNLHLREMMQTLSVNIPEYILFHHCLNELS